MSGQIFEYIRNRKSGKVGVIVGMVIDKRVLIGWSKCNVELDKFDTKEGLKIAVDRAMGTLIPSNIAPPCLHSQIRRFSSRCCRYFKGANQILLPID